MSSKLVRLSGGKMSELTTILQETGAKSRAEGAIQIFTWEGDPQVQLRIFEVSRFGCNAELAPTRITINVRGEIFDHVVKLFDKHFLKEEVNYGSASFRLSGESFKSDGAITMIPVHK